MFAFTAPPDSVGGATAFTIFGFGLLAGVAIGALVIGVGAWVRRRGSERV